MWTLCVMGKWEGEKVRKWEGKNESHNLLTLSPSYILTL